MKIFDLDAWTEIAETARSRPLRTGLTAFGVAWGTFMLVAMLGFSNGLERGVRRNMGDNATNAVHVWGQRTSMPYAGLQPGRWIEFDDDDTLALERNPNIDAVAPRSQLNGHRGATQVSHGSKVGSFGVSGDVPDYQRIQPFDIVARFVNDRDMEENRKVAVLGDQIVTELFGGEDPIGSHVEIRGVWFQVVGWFRSTRTGDQADRENGNLYVPYTTFKMAFDWGSGPSWYAITGAPDVSGEALEAEIVNTLAERHEIHPEDTMAIGAYNTEREFARIRKIFGAIRGITWFVGVATLLSGIVGVSNILLIAVRERTAEIGIRRAVGATPWEIVSSIVTEATVLTAVSGYVGVVMGVAVLELVSKIAGDDHDVLGRPQVDFQIVVVASIVLMFAGVIAGFLPARRAVAVRTVDALRAELG